VTATLVRQQLEDAEAVGVLGGDEQAVIHW
jgi:hypothetical protein